MRDREELSLLCHEFDEQREKINFAWNANTAVPPDETLPNDSKVKQNSEEIFNVEGVVISGGIGSVREIDPTQEGSGEKFKN